MAEFRMPALGADMDEGTVTEWLVHPGDEVTRGTIAAIVETDKSTIEAECFTPGTVGTLLIQEGTKVPVGTPLATILEPGAVPETAPVAAMPPRTGRGSEAREGAEREGGAPETVPRGPGVPEPVKVEPGRTEPGEPAVEPARPEPVRVRPRPKRVRPASGKPAPARPAAVSSPLVRRLARERGVPLARLHGTGPDGTITRGDVERASPGRVRASPYARRLAAEARVDLAALPVSAPDGALHAADVRAATTTPGPRAQRTTPPAAPASTESAPGPASAEAPALGAATAAPTRAAQEAPTAAAPGNPRAAPAEADKDAAMRRAIGRAMARSKREIPHYYLSATIDLTRALAWMREHNRRAAVSDRLVPSALLLKAAALALRTEPALNGTWADDRFVPGDGIHLGVAIALRHGGLIAPALRHADALALPDLMHGLRDLVERTRRGRLRGSELTDGTITVTNLGDQGVDAVYGVIYPPQVALVGFGRVAERPWAVDGMLGVRPLVTATLSADHRATDGYTGGRYLQAVARLLQRPEDL